MSDKQASDPASWVAFLGQTCIAKGSPLTVVSALKSELADEQSALVFDAISGVQIELDLRGSLDEACARLLPALVVDSAVAPRSPGRPKLGVVAREITLLPRHWDWLAKQTGGASVMLRKLVEEASRASVAEDSKRQKVEAAYRFMHAVAGNQPGFEEISRALFAHDFAQLKILLADWSDDVAQQLMRMLGEE